MVYNIRAVSSSFDVCGEVRRGGLSVLNGHG